MITRLTIQNFKRFAATELQFRPLTVLTGLNGTGKSTAIQALLLARQACITGSRIVQLNGPDGLALGEAFDILHPEASEQKVSVKVTDDDIDYQYVFGIPDDRALNLDVLEAPQQTPPALRETGTRFAYLSAERLGPRDQLSVTGVEGVTVGVGPQGEYTAQLLALRETEEVREPLRHPDTETHDVTTLRTQLEMWASHVIRPIRITAQWPPGIAASLIRFKDPKGLSEEIRPTNMGFGVSYALPILLAGLLMPQHGLLIVENPEAHLHPAGQSRLGRFLGRLAGSGAQVIVETHSDHVVNGIRLACIEESAVDRSDILIHFFDESTVEPATIFLTDRGGLTQWPQGLFDQFDDDLQRISRAKRRTR
jgi:predicted ATPase